VEQQIPFGDDNKKGKSNYKCKGKILGSFAALRMTTV
jgi:hypothetical protein